MTDQTALLHAICREPADDTPRLVYADWLDENDQPERAEFIRVQIEQARDWSCHGSGADPLPGICRGCDLFTRVQKLLVNNGFYAYPGSKWVDAECPELWKEWNRGATVEFTRGFISRIAVLTPFFLEHAKAIFSAYPVSNVLLVDKTPKQWPISGNWSWAFSFWDSPLSPSSDVLPGCLRLGVLSHPLKQPPAGGLRFVTKEDAITAASETAVNWARSLCDLPPLPLTQPKPQPSEGVHT